jgi:CheY-like chemotaxis protein
MIQLFHQRDPKSEEPEGWPFRVAQTEVLPDVPTGNETILLVEDAQPPREHMALQLRALGYTVIEARNVVDALSTFQKMRGRNINLLVTDIVMPKMGRKELAYRIRLLSRRTRVLFVSGYPKKLAIQNEIIQPNTPLLEKPVILNQLARMVRGILNEAKRDLDQELLH